MTAVEWFKFECRQRSVDRKLDFICDISLWSTYEPLYKFVKRYHSVLCYILEKREREAQVPAKVEHKGKKRRKEIRDEERGPRENDSIDARGTESL